MDDEADDVFESYGVLVVLPDPKNFTMIMETLTRIGYPSKNSNNLYQSCHIFHKRGQYAIMHFKEMFHFDGGSVDVTDDDIVKRDSIARLLEQWKLITINEDLDTEFSLKEIKIVPFQQKDKWNLIPKYQVGGHREKRS